MLDLIADVVLALAISHTAAIGFQELVIWLLLRVWFIFLSTKALVYQIKEDTLREVAEFAKGGKEGTLST